MCVVSIAVTVYIWHDDSMILRLVLETLHVIDNDFLLLK